MKVHTIFGPPGTGKTTRLEEIAEENAAHSGGILMLSFSRAAAAEFGSRVDPARVKTSTIHSLAYNAVNMNRASVMDKIKWMEFGRLTGIPFAGMDGVDEQQEGDEYMAVHSYAANRMLDENEAWDDFGRPGTYDRYRMFVDAYFQFKQTYGYADFDDMLIQCVALKRQSRRYPVIILDEAQDLSPLQWQAFSYFAQGADSIFVAGDDDQAIYEWNGADPHGMRVFSEFHQGDTEILRQSHRVPRLPLELAHNIVDEIKHRVPKTFAPRAALGTVTRYGDVDNMDLKTLTGRDAMILVRDSWRMREMQRLLNDEYIPYRMSNGQSPYENRYARAIRAWGDLQAGRELEPEHRKNLLDMCSTSIAAKIREGDGRAIKNSWQVALNIPGRLWDFYEKCDLRAPRTITLSTIHQAKGAEAATVLLDLTMPARVEAGIYRDRDAELRVLYVALTRVKSDLILCGSNPLLA